MTVSSTLSPGLDEKLDEPARGGETGNPPERSPPQANLEEDRSMISLIRAIPGSRLLSGLSQLTRAIDFLTRAKGGNLFDFE